MAVADAGLATRPDVRAAAPAAGWPVAGLDIGSRTIALVE